MTGYYLLDHPNPNALAHVDGRYHGRHPSELGGTAHQPNGLFVAHTAENATDLSPPDTGAEAIANYFATTARQASYHAIADSDSVIRLLPPTHRAWHVAIGWVNRVAFGFSFAARAHDTWRTHPEWGAAAMTNMAPVVAAEIVRLKTAHNINVPLRVISVDEARGGAPGFTGHSQFQPDRSDPNWHADDWARWFDHLAAALNTSPSPPTLVGGDMPTSIHTYSGHASDGHHHERLFRVVGDEIEILDAKASPTDRAYYDHWRGHPHYRYISLEDYNQAYNWEKQSADRRKRAAR